MGMRSIQVILLLGFSPQRFASGFALCLVDMKATQELIQESPCTGERILQDR